MENGNYVVKKWSELRIGQIVKIEEDEPFPADLLILATSDVKGEFLLLMQMFILLKGRCYIETKSLDGETNLKQKSAKTNILKMFQNPKDIKLQALSSLRLFFSYEKPNPYIYSFSGKITLLDGS